MRRSSGLQRASNTPPLISRMLTSKVPPPRSYTATSPSFLSTPYESAAAVGSLMMRSTSSPAILPASALAASGDPSCAIHQGVAPFVAWRCASLK